MRDLNEQLLALEAHDELAVVFEGYADVGEEAAGVGGRPQRWFGLVAD